MSELFEYVREPREREIYQAEFESAEERKARATRSRKDRIEAVKAIRDQWKRDGSWYQTTMPDPQNPQRRIKVQPSPGANPGHTWKGAMQELSRQRGGPSPATVKARR